jgi:hypothetical protein
MSIKQLLNRRKESFLNYLVLLTICILALVSANYISSVQDVLIKKTLKVLYTRLDCLTFAPLVLAPLNPYNSLQVLALRIYNKVLAVFV